MILILLLFLFACAISLGLMQHVQHKAIASIEGTLGELKKRPQRGPQISPAPELAPICPSCGGHWGKWSETVPIVKPHEMSADVEFFYRSHGQKPPNTTVLRHEQQRECTECGYAERKTVQ